MGEEWLNACFSTNPWGPIYSENKRLECPYGLKGKLHLMKGSLVRLPLRCTRRHWIDSLLLHFHVHSFPAPASLICTPNLVSMHITGRHLCPSPAARLRLCSGHGSCRCGSPPPPLPLLHDTVRSRAPQWSHTLTPMSTMLEPLLGAWWIEGPPLLWSTTAVNPAHEVFIMKTIHKFIFKP
jgi:hypothetical protein